MAALGFRLQALESPSGQAPPLLGTRRPAGGYRRCLRDVGVTFAFGMDGFDVDDGSMLQTLPVNSSSPDPPS